MKLYTKKHEDINQYRKYVTSICRYSIKYCHLYIFISRI